MLSIIASLNSSLIYSIKKDFLVISVEGRVLVNYSYTLVEFQRSNTSVFEPSEFC